MRFCFKRRADAVAREEREHLRRSTCNEYVCRPFEETSERERKREATETTDLKNGATEGTELKADASN
jgi:hypothetical protein